MEIVGNHLGIKSLIATADVAAFVADIADEIATDAAALVGPKSGQPAPVVSDRSEIDGPPAMLRRDMAGTNRARSVIIAAHLTPAGRKASREALQAAAAKGGRG